MSEPAIFKFDLGQKVALALSGEAGEIIGRAHYSFASPAYLVRYKAADGGQVESWWNQDAIVAA